MNVIPACTPSLSRHRLLFPALLIHISTPVSRQRPPTSRITVPTPSIRRYEASRIRPRPDPLSQTGLFYGLHLQKLYCSTLPPLPRSPPFAKEFFAPAHRHTATPRLFLSIRGCTRRHARGGEKQTHACVHTGRDIPISSRSGTEIHPQERERPGGERECFRSSRLSARLSFRSRKRVSGSQRVGELCDEVGKEGCERERGREGGGEEREREAEEKWKDRGNVDYANFACRL